jgi:hypothetical protein
MELQFDNEVRLAIYDFFEAAGRPPVAVDIARRLDARPPEVEAAYRRLADAHVLVLAPVTPYIWMANPFSALPTPFQVTASGREWWGNCIWDAMGIVAMLGGNGDVNASCADCGDHITLATRDGELIPQEIDESIVHFSIPAANWWDEIGFT